LSRSRGFPLISSRTRRRVCEVKRPGFQSCRRGAA
jgi:hypothetical protein